MKNVRFIFLDQSKPIHKLVSPEPHFVEEERSWIENHFKYLGFSYENDDIEEWDCFEMDNEGHLVSMKSRRIYFQLSNESIEHLSNFPHLRNLEIFSSTNIQGNATNLSLLSDLVNLTIDFEEVDEDLGVFDDFEFLKDLGLFSNLLYLDLRSYYGF